MLQFVTFCQVLCFGAEQSMDAPIQRRGDLEVKVRCWNALKQHLSIAWRKHRILLELFSYEPKAEWKHIAEERAMEDVLRDVERAPKTDIQSVLRLGAILS